MQHTSNRCNDDQLALLLVESLLLPLQAQQFRHTSKVNLLSSNSTIPSQRDPFHKLLCNSILDCKNMHTPAAQKHTTKRSC